MKKRFLLTLLILTASVHWIFSQATVTANMVQQPCRDDGIVAVSISGMVPPYQIRYYFFWSGGYVDHLNITNSLDTLKNIPAFYSSTLGNTMILNVEVNDYLGTFASSQAILQSPFTFTPSVTPAFCPNLGTASVTSTLSNTYVEWGLAYQIPFIVTGIGNPANLPPGNYDARVTDLNMGCSVTSHSFNLYIDNISGISYSPVTTPANCTNGSITLSAPVGGLAPYSYQWSNGANTSSIGGLTPGFYSVLVTDAQGCYEPKYINVQQTAVLTISSTVGNATCLQHDGSITAFAFGGTAPYTYAWNNGSTNQINSGLASGAYYLIATDNAGCAVTSNYINVNTNTPINVTYSASASSCTVASGSATVIPTGGTLPYTIIWSTYPVTTGAVISNVPPGTYNFKVVDAVGCSRTGSVYIPPISTINANISSINAICPGTSGNIYANVMGSNPPFTYQWNNGATTSSILNAPTGYYSCVITDAMQCTVSKDGSITQSSPISISLYNTSASCKYSMDGSATANATGGTPPYTYNWSGGYSGATISSLATNNYYVDVTDANGCYANDYTYVSYNAANLNCYCTITGTVYIDVNGNCTQDVGETGISNVMIHCAPHGYAFTDSNGVYSFQVPTGTYNISEQLNSQYQLSVCQANSTLVNVVASSSCIQVVNFANTIIPIHDLQIITTSANIPPVVGNAYTQKVIIQNNGTTIQSNIQVGYQHDGQLMYINNSPLLLTQQNVSVFPNWFSQSSIPVLNPNDAVVVDINYNVPTNIPIGTNLSFYDTVAYASPIITNWLTDHTPWDNVNTFKPTVIAAYDPNYKEVSPQGITAQGLIAPKDSILNYVIHFQNEGSYFAQNIIVVDTLDPDLDWTSLKPGYSDHKFTATISENGILTYTFNNIKLPWKASYGDALSSGMFAYSIKTKRNLPLGTTFVNGAAIYFDYNAPIITNKTLNTLDDMFVGIKQTDNLQGNETIVFPNPSSSMITINGIDLIKNIEVYNVAGARLFTQSCLNKTQTLQLQNFADGIYFVKVIYNNGLNVTKKIVVSR